MSELTAEHFKNHEKDDTRRFKELADAISDRPTKDEMENLFEAAFEKMIHKYFVDTGGNIKTWIVTSGIIIGSMVAIILGIKSLLGFVGIIIARQS